MNKELIILDESTERCIDFVESYLNNQNNNLYDPRAIAEELVECICKEIEPIDNIIVMDCDKTLSENDATYEFCHCLGIDVKELKSIFHNDRYTTYQFFCVARLYGSKKTSEIKAAAIKAKKTLRLSERMLSIAHGIPSGYFKLGITSGIYQIWELLLEDTLFDSLIGCSNFADMTYLITPSVKREVVAQLKRKGKTVVAVGDSLIDIPMLEAADSGLIVAHEKLSNAVVEYFDRFPVTPIRQLSLSNYKYSGIGVVEGLI